MYEQSVVLGGFEQEFMQKLALYLAMRMKCPVQIITDNDAESVEIHEARKIWIGSKAFLEAVQEVNDADTFIYLSDRTEEGCIFRFQSREKLYQQISEQCKSHWTRDHVSGDTKWIVMTTDMSVPALMAFSITYAQILGEQESVLYLDFSECSGMNRLFVQEEGVDLSDVIMAIRTGKHLMLHTFVRQMENVDYIMPSKNPMVLHELREEDIQKLITMILKSGMYHYVILLMGSTCSGCQRFFEIAEETFHITGNGALQQSSCQEWESFMQMCDPDIENKIKKVVLPEVQAEQPGVHLIFQWMDGELGKLARDQLDNEEYQYG